MIYLKKTLPAALAVMAVSFAPNAFAAQVTNSSNAEVIILVTQDGTRSELTVAVGQNLNFCEDGCFIALPNGDRHALTGTETVEILDGLVTIN